MLQHQLAAAIAAAQTPSVLDALARATWSALAGGHLTEVDAQSAATAIESRRGEWRQARELQRPFNSGYAKGSAAKTGQELLPKNTRTLFSRARVQRPPDRAASLARRRQLA